jgi:hypothetical protein
MPDWITAKHPTRGNFSDPKSWTTFSAQRCYRSDGATSATGTYFAVGRFGYRFNEQGQSRGGWIRNWVGDRESEWEKWTALLNEPIA